MVDHVVRLPLTSRVGVGALVLLHIVHRTAPSVSAILCLVPGNTFSGMVWNVITSAFVERSLVGLVVSSAAFGIFGRIFEPRWGLHETWRFVLVCAVSSALGSCVFIMIIYVATRSEQLLFVELSGLSGVVSGIAVAIHQAAHSDAQRAEVPTWLVGESRKVAMLYLLIHASWCLLTGRAVEILLAVNGLTFGWVYLRFYQPHESELGPSASVGDTSEAFAFASMFFSSLQPAVDSVSRATWSVVSSIVPPSLAQQTISLPSMPLPPPAPACEHLPGSNPSLAEQRRARAMKSLDERLTAKGSPSSTLPTAQRNVGADSVHPGAGAETV